ncbi:MAG: GtrA family protein [Clostridiales bacterium]|nr:GtrA family protein [Clostridiales bacterium]
MRKIIERIPRSFLRFLMVGGTATCIDFVLYWVLSRWIDFNIAKFCSTFTACVFSFFANRRFTFGGRTGISVLVICRFVLAQLVVIAVNVSLNYLIFTKTGVKIFGMVGATGVSMFVNYFLQRKFVFTVEE